MTRLRSPAGLSYAIVYLLLALFALPTQALYFYMKDGSPKCFHEELPKDTLVVGMFALLIQPHSKVFSDYSKHRLPCVDCNHHAQPIL